MEEYVLTSSHLTLYIFDVRWDILYNKGVIYYWTPGQERENVWVALFR